MKTTLLAIICVSLVEYAACACPTGWRDNADSCYLYFHEPYTFFDAKVACDIAEAHMVEIDNADENAFIVSLAKENRGNNLWMGLEDFIIEGQYQWTYSHTVPEYYNWADGDPNNWHYNEDCVAMDTNGGKWYDFDCEHKYPFICETAPIEDIIG